MKNIKRFMEIVGEFYAAGIDQEEEGINEQEGRE